MFEAVDGRSIKSINQSIDQSIEALGGRSIKIASLRTSGSHGSHGPSGLDAYIWRRMCSSFRSASIALCESMDATARRMCCNTIDPMLLKPFLAC